MAYELVLTTQSLPEPPTAVAVQFDYQDGTSDRWQLAPFEAPPVQPQAQVVVAGDCTPPLNARSPLAKRFVTLDYPSHAPQQFDITGIRSI